MRLQQIEKTTNNSEQYSSMQKQCQVCEKQVPKYTCPKCGIRYCSLACFKNEEKHVHDENTIKEQRHAEEDPKPKVTNVQLPTPKFDEIWQNSEKLQELLQYNTVKFHLAKVYRILNTGAGALGAMDTKMSTEMKQQLAVDYLNTLRYGGIHYNEAVEEFCQICLGMLAEDSG